MSKWWLAQLLTYHRFFSSLRTMWQKSVLYYLFWEGATITFVIILLRQESIKRILPISSSKTSAFFAQTLSLYCLCTGFKSKEGELWSIKKRIIGTRKPREPELRTSTVNIPFLSSWHGSDVVLRDLSTGGGYSFSLLLVSYLWLLCNHRTNTTVSYALWWKKLIFWFVLLWWL